MNRLFRSLPLALPLGLVAVLGVAACSYVEPPVLTISKDPSSAPFYTLTSQDLIKELQGSDTSASSTTKPSSYPAAQVASTLTTKVRQQVTKQVADDLKVTPTDDDSRLATQQAQQDQTGTGGSAAERAVEVALARYFAQDFFSKPGNNRDEYARKLYDSSKAQLTQPAQLCLHVITVDAVDANAGRAPTDAEYAAAQGKAQAARARIGAEPFEKVADEVSGLKDQAKGGDVGCRSVSEWPQDVVSSLGSTPAGVVTDPIKWRGGYVIVRVDDRKPEHVPSFEEVRTDVYQATEQNIGRRILDERLSRAFKSFVVTVDPQYGAWDAQQGQVTPPPGAQTPTTPTTSTTLPSLAPTPPGSTPPGSAPAGSTSTSVAP